MTSIEAGNLFRILDVILCLGYLPLICLRIMKRQDTIGFLLYLYGIFMVDVSIIYESWQRLGSEYHGAQALVTIGLVLLIVGSSINEFKDRNFPEA